MLLGFFERVWLLRALRLVPSIQQQIPAPKRELNLALRVWGLCFVCARAHLYSMNVPLIHLSPGRIRALGTFWEQIFSPLSFSISSFQHDNVRDHSVDSCSHTPEMEPQVLLHAQHLVEAFCPTRLAVTRVQIFLVATAVWPH